ncbi:MAG: DMT family transporter [Firmicutes bacterium]|nr:DMT family transporter [Bacillota bacterium]
MTEHEIQKRLQQKPVVLGLSALACLLWGSAFPFLKISYELLSLPAAGWGAKVLLAGYRFFIAGILLMAVTSLGLRQSLQIPKRTLPWVLLLGLLQTALQYFFFYNGLAYSTGIKSSIINATGSLFVVILSRLYYQNDLLTTEKLFGLLVGFAGVMVVNLPKGGLDLSFTFLGEGFLLLSSLVGAFGTILAKELATGVHPFLVTAYQMLFGSILLIITGGLTSGIGSLVFDWRSGLLLLYLAFASATAFAIWYSILKYNKPGEVAVYRFLIPIWGTLLSALFLGETIGLSTVLALAMVSIGIALVNRKRVEPAKTSS